MHLSLLAVLAWVHGGGVNSMQQLGDPLYFSEYQYGSLSGMSFSNDGSIVAIGDTRCDLISQYGSGCTRIYQWNGSLWNKLGSTITGAESYSYSGKAVSLSGNGRIIAIGEKIDNKDGMRVFEWNASSGVWDQKGNSIKEQQMDTASKYHISISNDGTIVAIGSRFNDDNGQDAGRVRIFQYDSTDWQQMGHSIKGETAGDFQGQSVSLSHNGMVVAIGAPAPSNENARGKTSVFEWNSSAWNQRGDNIIGSDNDIKMGTIVSLSADGNRVAVSGTTFSRTIRVYEWNNTTWTPFGQQIIIDFQGSDSMVLDSRGIRLAVGTRDKALIYDIINGIWTLDFTLQDDNKSFYGKYTSLSGDGSTVSLSSVLANSNYQQQVQLFQIPMSPTAGPTTSPTTSPTESEEESNEKEPDAALIGGIAGGVGGAALLGGVGYYVYTQYYAMAPVMTFNVGKLIF